jgi:hypothetical protein
MKLNYCCDFSGCAFDDWEQPSLCVVTNDMCLGAELSFTYLACASVAGEKHRATALLWEYLQGQGNLELWRQQSGSITKRLI